MFSLKEVLVTIAFVALINDKAISCTSSGSEKDQYQNLAETGIPKQLPLKTALPQSEEFTNEIEQLEPISDLLRILTHKNPDEKLGSKDEITPQQPSTIRHKRSLHPYPSEFKMEWPRLESPRTWNSYTQFVQTPSSDPDNETTNKNCEKKDSEPVDITILSNSGRTSRQASSHPLMAHDHTRRRVVIDQPIWDIAAYRPNIVQTSRQSRASKRELLVFEENEINDMQTGSLAIDRQNEPSRCSWAIVTCCSATSNEVNLKCFEELGCEGPFLDVSPCSIEFAKAAIQKAFFHYNSKP